MPYTWEDFRKDFTREHLHLLAPKERLEGISIKEMLKQFPPEEIEEYLSKLKP